MNVGHLFGLSTLRDELGFVRLLDFISITLLVGAPSSLSYFRSVHS